MLVPSFGPWVLDHRLDNELSSNFAESLVILVALMAANIPFLNQRLLLLGPAKSPKTLWVRLFELLVLYLLTGGVAFLLEQHAGQVAPQGWEFYAVTVCLFLTFAFPGFVFQYLVKRR